MAKSRSRKRSNPIPLGARQSPVISSTAGGRTPLPGTPSKLSLRPLPALPNPLPNPIPAIVRGVRENSLVQTRTMGGWQQASKRQPGRLPAKLAEQRAQLQKLFEVPAPVSRRRLNPCQARADRRSAVFAAGIAGKKWRAGGPKMWDARHNLNSSFTCRR